jgi:uncharacterized protein YegP (UPF0339 family)
MKKPGLRFQLSMAENGQYYFRAITEKEVTILKSEPYAAKSAAVRGIASVMENAPLDRQYVRMQTLDGMHFFALKARNGKVVVRSHLYDNRLDREKSLMMLMSRVRFAMVEDAA